VPISIKADNMTDKRLMLTIKIEINYINLFISNLRLKYLLLLIYIQIYEMLSNICIEYTSNLTDNSRQRLSLILP